MKAFTFVLVLIGLLTLSGCASVSTQFHFNHPAQFTTIQGAATPSVPHIAPTQHVSYTIQFKQPEVIPPEITVLNAQEVACMAQAIYFEARGESERGQIAVGYVILNRMKDKRFKSTACEVVHSGLVRNGRVVRNRCQFAWYCDGLSDVPKNPVAYARAIELAKLVLLKVAPNPIGNSLFFHGRSGKRRAARYYAETHNIGRHVFFAYVARI